MYTVNEIKNLITPIPQQVTAMAGQPLELKKTSKFCLSAPTAEKGPVKTAAAEIRAYLTDRCGEDCFSADGVPVTLSLGDAPAGVQNEKEAYRIRVSAEGVEITGFGPSGLYYGVLSFKQMCRWTGRGVCLPATEVLDWPDSGFRAYKQECRYGSNLMERQDWLDMVDELAEKKINYLSIGIYGCWVVQYDGKVSEYLYMPIKDYPQLQTPMTVKYWSAEEGKWYDYETLPPIFRDNLLGEIFAYAKDRGMDVIPNINSLGHNTLFPRMLPEVAPKNEDGTTNPTGFCTSNEETYKLLFSIYDQIIDDYMIPNEIYTFNVLMDEVYDQAGVDPDDPYALKSPWCQCPKCKGKEHSDIFIDHAIRVLKHLKEKGMKSIIIANDMLARKNAKLGPGVAEKFMKRVNEEGLRDVMLFDWWSYTDMEARLPFTVQPDDLGLRSIFCPWNGYYIWTLLTLPLRNCRILAKMNKEAKCGEGVYQYATWDRSYDLVHDGFADYGWNFDGAGTEDDVTRRYVFRHFAPMAEQAFHAFRLIGWITEQRKTNKDPENPMQTILSNNGLFKNLGYYKVCYFSADKPYPRHFPGEQLTEVLEWRQDYERMLYSIASMAKEALAIFEEMASHPECDQTMARRLAYECANYQVLAENWLAFLQIYDLTQGGDQKKIATIARARQNAQLALMKRCEQVKEHYVVRSATMRNHSVFMQTFADIADYIESTDAPALDIMDITAITSSELRMIR